MCFRTAGQTLLNIATILFKQVSRLFTINHSMKRTVKSAWALKRSNARSLSSTAQQSSSLSHHAPANRSETMKLQTIKFFKKKWTTNLFYWLINKQKKSVKLRLQHFLVVEHYVDTVWPDSLRTEASPGQKVLTHLSDLLIHLTPMIQS